ncbi:hypothetical protein E18064_290040 [Elizabethkingia anophelis]|nr:hypothetical protein E18064_290040 [Elizabethkingia anophelis]
MCNFFANILSLTILNKFYLSIKFLLFIININNIEEGRLKRLSPTGELSLCRSKHEIDHKKTASLRLTVFNNI